MLTLFQRHPNCTCTMYVQCSLYEHGTNLLISKKKHFAKHLTKYEVIHISASSHESIQQLFPVHLVMLLFCTTVLSQNEVHDWLKGVLHGG